MARSGFNEPIEPMDLANMRANGVRSLLIWCRNCHYEKIMNVDHLPGNVTVPSLGQRMSCINAAPSEPTCTRTGKASDSSWSD